jgi:hypothetical protein
MVLMENNWRLVLGSVVVLIIVVSAIIAGFDTSGLTGFSIFNSNGPTKNITFNGFIEVNELEFNLPSESIYIELPSQDNSVFIGEQKVDLTNSVELELKNFEGSVKIKNDITVLSGKTEKLSVNGVEISHKSGQTEILLDNVEYIIISTENTVIQPKRYEKVKGYTDINDGSLYIQLNEETLDIGAFRGSVGITDGGLTLDGIVDKVLVDGKSRFSINE